MSFMGTGDLLGLKNFFKNKDYQYFCLLKDPASGEMVHWGDSAFAFDFLNPTWEGVQVLWIGGGAPP